MDGKMHLLPAGYTINFDTVDEGLAKKFFKDIGLGRLRELPRKTGPNRNFMVWRWECTSADECRDVLLLVLPFLSPRQTAKAGDMIRRIERSKYWRTRNPEKAAALETPKTAE